MTNKEVLNKLGIKCTKYDQNLTNKMLSPPKQCIHTFTV